MFKVGDKVKVLKSRDIDTIDIGKVGEVLRTEEKFNMKLYYLDVKTGNVCFSEEELGLVEPKNDVEGDVQRALMMDKIHIIEVGDKVKVNDTCNYTDELHIGLTGNVKEVRMGGFGEKRYYLDIEVPSIYFSEVYFSGSELDLLESKETLTNNRNRIINLVGASGTGKTTIAKELEKQGYNIIHSYTTRKPREENEWGHIFLQDWLPVYVDGIIVAFEDVKGETIDIDEMIAYKNLYGDHYFATKEQYQGKGTSIYVVDPEGAKQIKENVKDAEVVTILLNADSVVRLQRLMKRGYTPNEHEFKGGESGDNYYNNVKNKATERMINDMKIFSKVKCDYAVDANGDVEEVLTDIIEIIGDQDVY